METCVRAYNQITRMYVAIKPTTVYIPIYSPFDRVFSYVQTGHDDPVHEPVLDVSRVIGSDRFVG